MLAGGDEDGLVALAKGGAGWGGGAELLLVNPVVGKHFFGVFAGFVEGDAFDECEGVYIFEVGAFLPFAHVANTAVIGG